MKSAYSSCCPENSKTDALFPVALATVRDKTSQESGERPWSERDSLRKQDIPRSCVRVSRYRLSEIFCCQHDWRALCCDVVRSVRCISAWTILFCSNVNSTKSSANADNRNIFWKWPFKVIQGHQKVSPYTISSHVADVTIFHIECFHCMRCLVYRRVVQA